MILPPYRYGQASQIQNQSMSLSLSWSRSWSRSWSWLRSGSRVSAGSWEGPRSASFSACGHGSAGGPSLSPMDYLL